MTRDGEGGLWLHSDCHCGERDGDWCHLRKSMDAHLPSWDWYDGTENSRWLHFEYGVEWTGAGAETNREQR